MILARDLGAFHPGWAGWRLTHDGEIAPPFQSWTVRREDALAVPLMHRQIVALRAKIEELEKALVEARAGRSEQPHPDTWAITIKAG